MSETFEANKGGEGIENWHPDEADNNTESEEDRELVRRLGVVVEQIVREILPDIEKGNYDQIIGDDASARLPTIMVSEIISMIYRHSGNDVPRTIFAAGSRFIDPDRIQSKVNSLGQHIRNNKGDLEKKTLVVTEVIETGKSLTPLLAALNNLGISYDTAGIDIMPSNYLDPDFLNTNHGRLINGRNYNLGFDLHNKPRVSGVIKVAEDTFSQKVPDPESAKSAVQFRHMCREVSGEIAQNLISEIDEIKGGEQSAAGDQAVISR